MILDVTLFALLISSLLMILIWIMCVYRRDASMVDLGWAQCIFLTALTFFLVNEYYPFRKIVLMLMFSIWSWRLSILLIRRFLEHDQEDPRYALLRKDWQPMIDLKFFGLFIFEAVLAVGLVLPFWNVFMNPIDQFGFFEIIGIILFVGGFIGINIADNQLKHFKKANKGKVCNQGLWKYSRHPNYFFEWTIWCSMAIFGLGSPNGYFAFISAGVMFWLLNYVTGVPFAEQRSLVTRGDLYKEYQRHTNRFFLGPQKQ